MLGGKIEPRQDKTGQDRAGQDKTREDKTKTRQDKFLRGGGTGLGGLEFIPSLIGGIPGPWTPSSDRCRRLMERLVGHLGAHRFCIVFWMPIWMDFWSILLPNLAPKIHQNR